MPPGDENSSVFSSQPLVRTATAVPAAGSDNHVGIEASSGAWSGVSEASFINGLAGGQHQDLVCSADQVSQIQQNQIINIDQSQSTKAQQQITITSVANMIHIKAATQIILEVGASKLVMDAAGNITLSGAVIKILGSTSTDISAPNNHIGGITKMDGGEVFIN